MNFKLHESKKSAEERFVNTGEINAGTFNELLNGDLSSNKKYIEKMCDFFIEMKNSERWKDSYELHIILSLSHLIEEFHSLCNKNIISGSNKDIQQYKSIFDFEEVILNSRNKISNTEKRKKQKNENSINLYDDNTWNLTSILNWTGAKKVGIGTKWCITFNSPVHWNQHYWKHGKHFHVITNKILDKQNFLDDQKNPLYKVAAEISYSGEILNLWDALDNFFNPHLNTGMTSERQVWWDSIPQKIKKILQKPEPHGEARKIIVDNYNPSLGHDTEKNVEKIEFKDFYINSDVSQIDFSKMKNINFKITGNIIVSGTDFTSLESFNFNILPIIESLKIQGNSQLTSLRGIPKKIQGNLTIEDNPKLKNDAIDDLIGVSLRKHLTWKNNAEPTNMYNFINKKWAPILGRIDAK